MGVVKRFNPKWSVFLLTLVTCGGALYSSLELIRGSFQGFGENSSGGAVTLFNQMMISDTYSTFFHILFLAAAGLTALASFRYLDREKLQHPEYYVLLLFSVFGMMLMASSLDLIVLFIALELMSLCIYVLVGFRRADRRSNEASDEVFYSGFRGVCNFTLWYGLSLWDDRIHGN